MPLPIGSDQTRTRYPKLTITIMVVCFVAYIITYWLHGAYGLLSVPVTEKLDRVESELMAEYLRSQGEGNPDQALSRYSRDPIRATEFRKEFREAMENGEVVPRHSLQYKRWEEAYGAFVRARKKDPVYLLGYVPADPGPISIITHMFMHGSFWHWLGNMYFLWLVGLSLEDIWGRKYYGLMFLAGGVAAALSHHAINPDSDVPMVGASGAIAALMGAYTIRFRNAKLRFVFFTWEFWLAAWVLLLFWFVREIYYALQYWGQFTGVAQWAHIGGYAFGIAAAGILIQTGAEKTLIGRALEKQDEKDKEKARRKAMKQAGPPPRSEELEQAIEARKLREFDKAVKLFREAIAKDPRDLEAREDLVRLLFEMDRKEECAKETGGIIALFLKQGETDRALGWYGEMGRLGLTEKDHGEWKFQIGQQLQKMGDWEDSIKLYRDFAQWFPQDQRAPKALFLTATILTEKLSKHENAVQFYDYIMKAYPRWMPDQVAEARRLAGKKAAGAS